MTILGRKISRGVAVRRGLSLVELLLVLATSSIVLAVVSITMASLLKLDQKFADGRSQWARQAQLIKALRRDAHESTQLSFDKETFSISFQNFAGDRIRYSVNGEICERQIIGLSDSRSRFRLSEGVRWSVSPAEGKANDLIELVFTLPDQEGRPTRAYSIKMALGRDLQLAQTTE